AEKHCVGSVGDFPPGNEEHDRRPGARERTQTAPPRPRAIAGGKDDSPVDAPQRRGDGGGGHPREPRRDAGDDPERYAGGLERQRLLAATPEHARVAALEPQDALSGAREFNEAG